MELKILQRSYAELLQLQSGTQPEAFVMNLERSCQRCKPEAAAGLDHDPGPEKKKCLTGVGKPSEEAGTTSTFPFMILNTYDISFTDLERSYSNNPPGRHSSA
jgi:hypothetical protein